MIWSWPLRRKVRLFLLSTDDETNLMVASGKGAKSSSKTKGEKKAAQIADGVEAMKLDDTPKAKSKNLDVLAEFKKNKSKNSANFVVIGML